TEQDTSQSMVRLMQDELICRSATIKFQPPSSELFWPSYGDPMFASTRGRDFNEAVKSLARANWRVELSVWINPLRLHYSVGNSLCCQIQEYFNVAGKIKRKCTPHRDLIDGTRLLCGSPRFISTFI